MYWKKKHCHFDNKQWKLNLDQLNVRVGHSSATKKQKQFFTKLFGSYVFNTLYTSHRSEVSYVTILRTSYYSVVYLNFFHSGSWDLSRRRVFRFIYESLCVLADFQRELGIFRCRY